MTELVESMFINNDPTGRRSRRTYTHKEIAAARRLGLVNGSQKDDTMNGPMFFGTGDYYPNQIEQLASDAAIVLAAIKREWPKEGKKRD